MKFYAHFNHINGNNKSDRVNEIEAESLELAEVVARDKPLTNYILTRVLNWEELEVQEPGWAYIFIWKKELGQEKKPQNKNGRKLSENQFRKLMIDRRNGVRYKDLVKKYGISTTSLSNLLNNKSYKD